MRRAGPILAAAVVLLADAVALTGVARNRSSEPDATLELTERELELPYVRKEDTGLALRISWDAIGSEYSWGPPDWFDKAKLEEIGYDCSLPLDDPLAETWYGKARTRQVYAVLEHDGLSWREWLDRQQRKLDEMAGEVGRREKTPGDLEFARERFERDRRTKSRMFLIDVGRDPAALRAKHPDTTRFIVTPALVDLSYWRNDPSPESAHLTGSIRGLMVSEIHVPRGKRSPLDAILASREERERLRASAGSAQTSQPDDEVRGPAYAVTIAYGRRHEPWLVAVRPLAPAGQASIP